MPEQEFKYVFGPVPSRRLGLSLGVDLVPFKTCTYNCVYCQLGLTPDSTAERREYVPLDEVVAEIGRKLAAGTAPDYITLSGSGEPTLYSRIGELVLAVKRITDVSLAVITNSSLLWDKDIQGALLPVDLVVPSLDAGDAQMFKRINRAHQGVDFEKMVAGLVEFSKRFSNRLWLEVFLLGGLTDTESEVKKIVSHVDKIKPDKIQLNTVSRPPAESSALAVPLEKMQEFAGLFGENVEVIADYSGAQPVGESSATGEDVLNMLKRRPCSLDDVATGLGIKSHQALELIERLVADKAVVTEKRGDRVFYLAR